MPHEVTDVQQVINKIVRERLETLSLKTFEELVGLPAQSSEEIVVQGNKLTLSVWHDILVSQDHRIVIQAYKPWVLGIGRMYADGFVVNGNNEKRQLTEEELSPFS